MRALAIVHQRDAGPGVFSDALRERGVALDRWMPPEAEHPPRPLDDYGAVFVLGGAMHVDQEDRHPWLRGEKALLSDLLQEGKPMLGVCLGAQLLAGAAGAPARRARRPEIGWFDVEVSKEGIEDPLLGPLGPRFSAFEWHSYEFGLPESATPLARSETCLQAYRIGDRTWGIQFHAEVSRRDAATWIEDHRSDPDAVRTGVDPGELGRETGAAIGAWNTLGRELCGRFLDAVSPG